MRRSALPQLPPDVLDRLASCEGVVVHVGRMGEVPALPGVCVPLRGCTYLLLCPTAATLAQLKSTTHASFSAEGPGGSWSVLSRGRLLWGRNVSGESRRAELAHWVPDGGLGWIACRFYPEHLDFQEDTPSGRRRAAGEVPGVERPSGFRFYLGLAYEPFQVWFLVSGALVAAGILVIDSEDAGTPLVLLTALAAGQLTVVAARVLLAPVDLLRWREGKVRDEQLGALEAAWFAPDELRTDGLWFAAAAAALWALLVLLAGSAVAALVSLLSGAPVILLAMALRRRMAEAEEGNRP